MNKQERSKFRVKVWAALIGLAATAFGVPYLVPASDDIAKGIEQVYQDAKGE